MNLKLFKIFSIILIYFCIFLLVKIKSEEIISSEDVNIEINPFLGISAPQTHDSLRRKPKQHGFRGKSTPRLTPKSNYQIWPQPKSVSMWQQHLVINSHDFKFTITSQCELIISAIKRYRDRIFLQDCSRLDFNFRGKPYFYQTVPGFNYRNANNLGALKSLKLTWSGPCEKYPQMSSNEAYDLQVDSAKWAEIKASSVWGIVRGLETFSQLVENIGTDEFKIHVVEVKDAPRFAHRQLMIDTSRHFLSVRSIQRTLDAMEMNKLNVLHWHVVDDQSFPFVSEEFPELARNGSWTQTHIYGVKDVEKIIDHARLRGIRVLAEFDTPGHTLSWGKGIPSLLTECYNDAGKPNGKLGPFDPTKKATYDFLHKFFSEIARRFPDQYLHLGGDEVDAKCWASNPKIKKMMEQRKFTRLGQVESFYIQRLVNLASELKKSYIVWQDVFDEGVKLAPETLVHVWIEKRHGGWRAKMDQVTKAGFKTLLSAPWYLEEAYTEAWRRYYETELLDWDGDEAQKNLVLGGGACMWGEYVDGGNVINKIWTTTSALAEKLWSPQSFTKEAAKAETRFHLQHCRMQMLGIRVGPLDGPGFCPCDFAV